MFISAPAIAQHAANSTHFYWTLRKAHELPYNATIARSTELTSTEKSALIRAIAAEIRPFMEDPDITSEKELHRLVRNTRIKLLDLNEDGVPEILAQAFDIKEGCGATGNCSFWVFQKQNDTYKKASRYA